MTYIYRRQRHALIRELFAIMVSKDYNAIPNNFKKVFSYGQSKLRLQTQIRLQSDSKLAFWTEGLSEGHENTIRSPNA